MKLRILPYLLLMLLANACHTSGPVNKELRLADSIMEENPDTAMYVLTRIADPTTMTAEEYAMYCLLTTQAADLTNTPHTNDDLISVAVQHFDAQPHKDLSAKAHYYMARVQEDLQRPQAAETHYMQAAALMEKTGNYRATARVYDRIAKFMAQHQKHAQANEMLQQAYNNNLLATRQEARPNPLIWLLPVAALLLMLVLTARMWRMQRRIDKQIQHRKIELLQAETTIQTQHTELTHLRKELATMRKELYTRAEIVQKVRQLNTLKPTGRQKPELTEHDWNTYLELLDDTFGFVSTLRNTYHRLTDVDIRICALLREGIATLHIGTLMNMTPDTLSRRMQRIKSEKMNMAGAPQTLEMMLKEI